MSIFIVGIMVLSVFGVLLNTQSSDLRYNDFKFSQQDNIYITKINGKPYSFYTLPGQFYVNFSSIVANKLREADFVMITFDPYSVNESAPFVEVFRFDVSQNIGKGVIQGVAVPSELYSSLPNITCSDATLKTPVIFLNISDKLEIIDVDSCIYFNGRAYDFLRFRDRVLYAMLGVMPDDA